MSVSIITLIGVIKVKCEQSHKKTKKQWESIWKVFTEDKFSRIKCWYSKYLLLGTSKSRAGWDNGASIENTLHWGSLSEVVRYSDHGDLYTS